jgi:hypothetical protein
MRGIQYAAAFRFRHRRLGILDYPLSRMMTTECTSAASSSRAQAKQSQLARYETGRWITSPRCSSQCKRALAICLTTRLAMPPEPLDMPPPALPGLAWRVCAWLWEKASRGCFAMGALARTGNRGGTIVGRLVSKSIRSGHLWADWMRMIDLSTRASRMKDEEEASAQYRSARNSIAKSRLPTKKK